MRRTSKQSSSPDGRTRYLNIVYFVESARSHTIRINLAYARWAIGTLAIVGVWAVGSVVWILHLEYQSAKTRDRLETALTTIFDFQIKNDKVFEQAYPPEATHSYYSELAQLPSNNPLADQPEPKTTHTEHAQKVTERAVVAHPPQTQHDVSPGSKKAGDESPNKARDASSHLVTTPVSTKHSDPSAHQETMSAEALATDLEISGAKLAKSSGRLSLEFNIRNKKAERSEGFIWAVAMITDPNGQSKAVAAPPHTKIDTKSGIILSAKTAYRFSILRFKNKEFDFQVSTTSSWKLTKLTIHFSDLQGEHEQKVKVPVEQVAVTSAIDTPTTEIKL